MKKIFWLAILITICYADQLPAQQNPNDIIYRISQQNTVLSYIKWDAGKKQKAELFCIIYEKDEKSIAPAKLKVIKIYNLVNRSFEQVYTYETLDNPLGLFPIRDSGGQLVTLWITGTAYRIYVLDYIDGKIIVTLDKGSKSLINLIHQLKE